MRSEFMSAEGAAFFANEKTLLTAFLLSIRRSTKSTMTADAASTKVISTWFLLVMESLC
jgi:hypothetical protein